MKRPDAAPDPENHRTLSLAFMVGNPAGKVDGAARRVLLQLQLDPASSVVNSVAITLEAKYTVALDTDDDDNPYRLAADPEQKEPCPKCQESLPLGAIVCSHCGFNRQTGKTLQRVYEKVDKQWEAGPRRQVRVAVVLGVSGLALAAVLFVGVAEGNLLGLAPWWIIGTALWTIILGTYPRVDLARSQSGEVRLTKTFRVCFIPLGATDIRWRAYQEVVTTLARAADIWDWIPLFFLALMGGIPALFWWLFVIKPDHFEVALSKDRGSNALLLYRGANEDMAKDIAASIRGVTGLA